MRDEIIRKGEASTKEAEVLWTAWYLRVILEEGGSGSDLDEGWPSRKTSGQRGMQNNATSYFGTPDGTGI